MVFALLNAMNTLLLLLHLSLSHSYSNLALEEIFTVSLDPRINLYPSEIDTSVYELGLLEPSHKNIGLRTLVFIDNRPAIYEGLSLSRTDFLLSKREILNDVKNRVSDTFEIPDNLYSRVSFWFDIYSRYTSKEVVIHDQEHPWIVYEVIDTSAILDQPDKHKWTKYHESQRYVKKVREDIKRVLRRLANRKSFKNLSHEEQKIFRHFARLKNPRKTLRKAHLRVRGQTGQKDHFEQGLLRSTAFLPEMEKIFASHGLPYELTRIPLVESSFNVEAISKVGASGIWQIMPYIGKKFGLLRGKSDLRNDVFASTKVAAKLLRQKHNILKEWPLSVTAYNHGPSGLLKAMKRYRTKDLGQIVEKNRDRRFGFASENFYACFLASLYAERYQDALFHSLDPLLLGASEKSETDTTLN